MCGPYTVLAALGTTQSAPVCPFLAVLVSSIWDDDIVYEASAALVRDPEPAAAGASDRKRKHPRVFVQGDIQTSSRTGRDLDAIRQDRVESKRRVAYERAHFALVGRPTPTVIPFRQGKHVVPPPAPTAPGRILRNLYISQVGRFQFRLIHR